MAFPRRPHRNSKGQASPTFATEFQFIHVNDTGAGQKKKNLSIAHSHAMRGIRRARREREQLIQLEAIKLAEAQDALDILRWEELASESASNSEGPPSPSPQSSWTSTSSSSSGSGVSWTLSSQSSWDDQTESIASFRDISSISNCLRPSLDLSHAPALTRSFGAQSSLTSQLLNHSLKVFWPGVLPAALNEAVHPYISEWWSLVCQSPAVFHAFVYIGAQHSAFIRQSTDISQHPAVLNHKAEAIKSIKHMLTNARTACSDEIILAVWFLACAELNHQRSHRRFQLPFTPPLTSPGWINVLGNCVPAAAHGNAMRPLVAMRGGIQNLQYASIRKGFQTSTTYLMTLRLVKPYYPFFRESEESASPVPIYVNDDYVSRRVLKTLDDDPFSPKPPLALADYDLALLSRFPRLIPFGLTLEAAEVFDAVRAYSISAESYSKGEPCGVDQRGLLEKRDAVQLRLVSLPLGQDLEDLHPQRARFYELCRLTTLLYACAVTFPIPTSSDWDENLVSAIKATIEMLSFENESAVFLDTLLWASVLAGIAASDMPERAWFVDTISGIVLKRGLSSWDDAKVILLSFLWMETACDRGATPLWDEVLDHMIWVI